MYLELDTAVIWIMFGFHVYVYARVYMWATLIWYHTFWYCIQFVKVYQNVMCRCCFPKHLKGKKLCAIITHERAKLNNLLSINIHKWTRNRTYANVRYTISMILRNERRNLFLACIIIFTHSIEFLVSGNLNEDILFIKKIHIYIVLFIGIGTLKNHIKLTRMHALPQ